MDRGVSHAERHYCKVSTCAPCSRIVKQQAPTLGNCRNSLENPRRAHKLNLRDPWSSSRHTGTEYGAHPAYLTDPPGYLVQ